MLQYILPFLEIVLFLAIGYIYWRTRIVVANLHIPSSDTLSTAEQVENQAEMMREVATLIAEWEAVTSAVRADLSYQQATVEETLQQAEATTTKLQELMVQAEMMSIKQLEQQPVNYSLTPGPDPSRNHAAVTTPKTLAEAIKVFSEYLRVNHYGQSTITRTVNYVQKFAAWLDGQAEIDLPVRPIILAEIELYRRRLEAQQTPNDAVEREVAALKMFANWVNSLDGKTTAEVSSTPTPPVPAQPTPLLTGKSVTQSFDRYHTVFALAQQGVAPATITAQTGLEREAIRLLLTMGPPSLVKN